MNTLRLVLRTVVPLCLALPLGNCACGPTNAGDPCDPTADAACPADLVCQDDDDGDARCHVAIGDSCDADADEAFCADGTSCTGADDDAVCGGRGSTCSEGDCGDGLVCAPRSGGEPACQPPVLVRGIVLEVQTDDAIAGAHVLALDVQGTALTRIAESGVDGSYLLEIPGVERNDDGDPTSFAVTLRAAGREHITFPSGLRTALPIDVADAVEEDIGYVVEGSLTTIALLPLPAAQQGRPIIAGLVTGAFAGGMLVVAEGTGVVGQSAIVDVDGTFTIFHVAPGTTTLRGYAGGLLVDPVDVTVAADDVTGVELVATTATNAVVSGSVQVVNGNGFSDTSVVLVPESTFDDTFVRGDVPRGLRAPGSGPPSITGSWSIAGVPPGRYVVLAAFENDGLVRDPDENISGTDLVRIDVAGADVSINDGFKITGALDVLSPGSNGLEVISDATPDFVFEDDSSEEFYEVIVYNALGDTVWESGEIPSVSGSDVTVTYAGEALEDGMVYQFKATSFRSPGGNVSAISTTEDLKGVFGYLAP